MGTVACRWGGGGVNRYLQSIPFTHPDFTRRMLADGTMMADQSCRISGTLSLAIRNASNEQIDAILDHMLADGCSTMADACHWLNANYSKILETCGISVY